MTIAESAARPTTSSDDGWRVLQRRELPVDLLDVSARCTGSEPVTPRTSIPGCRLRKRLFTQWRQTVTIKMKGYKWSNGETVDAQDVVFWMNLVKADATSWAAYVPGPSQYPGDAPTSSLQRADTVSFTLDAAYSQYWFTYND